MFKNLSKIIIVIALFNLNLLNAKAADECFEGVSRSIFKFNLVFDQAILEPVAKGYDKLPDPIKTGTSNFTSNIATLLSIPNSLLQGNLNQVGHATGSFLVNSTLGVLGFLNPAEKIGLKPHKEDVGQTLGVYGVGPGCYLVLPILGPSTARDTLGLVADTFIDPFAHVTIREKELLGVSGNNIDLPGTYSSLNEVPITTHADMRTGIHYTTHANKRAFPFFALKHNPFKNEKLAKYRRNLVINNLYENSYITKEQHKELIKSEIKLKKRKRIYLENTRYFIEDIRKKVIEFYGHEKVYEQGFNIKTPLNLELQNLATKALRKGLIQYDRRKGWRGPLINKKVEKNWRKDLENFNLEKSIGWELAIVKRVDKFEAVIETKKNLFGTIGFENINWTRKNLKELLKIGDIIYVKKIDDGNYSLQQLPKVNGGIVVMDPYSGRVLAMSGGFSFKKSEFNRATQASRQPGSAFKPFIYALALENNFTPSTLVLDAPIVLDQGSDLKLWKPENYGKKFYGPSTLRTGVEKSRNLMTVRISQELGIDKIINFSKKLNIYENPDELMSVSLGSAETTLLKITSAYCSFANGGKLVTPILIDRIQDSEGKTIFNNEKRLCINCDQISYEGNQTPKIKNNYKQIFSPQTAYQMTSILEGVIKRGTGKGLKDLNLQLAGKTGTTNNNTDTWFIGFTSNLVIGVYVGHDNPRNLGKYETGSKTAMPIFKDFIKKAVTKYEARPFKIAKDIKMVVIDAKTGKKADFGSKKTIIESFKKEKIENKLNIGIGNFKYKISKNNILKFY